MVAAYNVEEEQQRLDIDIRRSQIDQPKDRPGRAAFINNNIVDPHSSWSHRVAICPHRRS